MLGKNVDRVGFLDVDIDVKLDLFKEIERLKKKRTQLYWRIITRRQIYRMWRTILGIV